MLKLLRLPLLLLLLSPASSGAEPTSPSSNGGRAPATSEPRAAGGGAPLVAASANVATAAALSRWPDDSRPVHLEANGGVYIHQKSACSSNNGSGDGGTQFPDLTGAGCWVAASFVPITTSLFMIDSTGETDVSNQLQAALNAAAARNTPLSLCGSFKISRALTLTSRDALTNTTSGIVGCGSSNAVILTSSPTQDGIFFSGSSFGRMFGCVVKNLTIKGPSPNFKTAGSGVHILYGNECRVEDLVIENQYSGIYLDSTALSYVALNAIRGLTAARVSRGSTAIALHGSDVGSVIFSNYSDNAATMEPSIGISLNDNVNGEYIEDNSMSRFVVGFNVAACTVCKIQNIFSRQNAYDISTEAGMNFRADGPIYRIFSVNDWSAATQDGPCLRTDGYGRAPGGQDSPAMSNWQFDAFQCRGNNGSGIWLGGNLKGASFTNLVSTANNGANKGPTNAGVVINAPVNHVSFTGGIVGPTAEEFNYQDYGFIVGSGVDFVSVVNVDVSGNRKAPFANRATTSTHNVFANNTGYNPVGASNIVVGPSPWTYRAGPSSETLYVHSGSCSEVTQQDAVINGSCTTMVSYQLGPNETLGLRYTAAPKVTRVIH